MNLVHVISTTTLISCLPVTAGANEADRMDLSCEYPLKDSVYASVTDLIIVGRCETYRGPLVIYTKDSNNVVHQSAICHPDAAAQGAWSCRIELPRHSFVKPGKYTLEAVPVVGPSLKVPIKIVIDPSGDGVPLPLPLTSPESVSFEKLPLLKLKKALLSSSDVTPRQSAAATQDGQAEVALNAESEFAIEGSFQTDQIPDFPPPEVVVRLTDALNR